MLFRRVDSHAPSIASACTRTIARRISRIERHPARRRLCYRFNDRTIDVIGHEVGRTNLVLTAIGANHANHIGPRDLHLIVMAKPIDLFQMNADHIEVSCLVLRGMGDLANLKRSFPVLFHRPHLSAMSSLCITVRQGIRGLPKFLQNQGTPKQSYPIRIRTPHRFFSDSSLLPIESARNVKKRLRDNSSAQE